MKAGRSVFLCAIACFIGIVAGIFFRSNSHLDKGLSFPFADANRDFENIPQLVASQIKSGNFSCPNFGSISYEACLIFQGALGVWSRVGYSDACPNIASANDQKVSSNIFASHKLQPEDALRAPTVPCFSYLYAIQVANVVPVLISTANRTFQMSGTEFSEPGSNPDLCIKARHGICGNQTAVALALFEKAGFKARSVEFYYESSGKRLNHIIPEVLIDGDWRPIDTTYGAYWANDTPNTPFSLKTLNDVLKEARHKRPIKLMYNTALLPYGVYATVTHLNYFDYLVSNADIIRGGKGRVKLSIQSGKGIENFGDRPNYIGDNVKDGDNEGIVYKFDHSPGVYKIHVNVLGSATEGNESVDLCIDRTCTELSKENQKYEFLASNPSQMYLKSDLDLAYVVLSSIEWERMH